jgi:proline racemase
VRTRGGGTVDAVTFCNVPSFVVARDVAAAGVAVDVSYGGAIYASVPAARFGLRVVPDDLPALIAAGRAVKAALAGTEAARHPADERLSGIYGTVLYEDVGERHQRNVTIFADGEVDRSPCGSGTSARCALLAADGTLRAGDVLRHDSIVGSTFLARVVGHTRDGVLTEVEGMAYRTGEHRFVLDPRDPLGTGFVLR